MILNLLYQFLWSFVRVIGNRRCLRNLYILTTTAHRTIWILPDVWSYLIEFSAHEEHLLPYLPVMMDLWPTVGPYIHDLAPHIHTCAPVLPELLDTLIDNDLLLLILPRCIRHVRRLQTHLELLVEYRTLLIRSLPVIVNYIDSLEENIEYCADDLDIILPALEEMIKYLPTVKEYVPELIQMYRYLPDDKTLKRKLVNHIPQLVHYAPEVCRFKTLLIPHIHTALPHIDVFLLFGPMPLEPFIPYLDDLLPYLNDCAPYLHHFVEIKDDLPVLLPYIVEHIPDLVNSIHETAQHVPLIVPRIRWAVPAFHRFLRVPVRLGVLPQCARLFSK